MRTAVDISDQNGWNSPFRPSRGRLPRERRAEIDAYFAALEQKEPALWNGRVLLLHSETHAEGVFSGRFLETDFASFVAWRGWGRPPAGIYRLLRRGRDMAADGALLLGVMGAHTANAGHIYFPCGTPDPDDIVDGKVDLEGASVASLRRRPGSIPPISCRSGLDHRVRRPALAQDQGPAKRRKCRGIARAHTASSCE